MESPQARFSQEEEENVCDQTHHYLPHDHTHPQSQSAQIFHLGHQEEEYWEKMRTADLGWWGWMGVQEEWWGQERW